MDNDILCDIRTIAAVVGDGVGTEDGEVAGISDSCWIVVRTAYG